MTEQDLAAIHQRLTEMLAGPEAELRLEMLGFGAPLAAIYARTQVAG